MKIDLNSRIARSDGPVSAPVDDELVMADVDAGKYYALNNIATAIWEGIENEIAVRDLISNLQNEYNVPPDRCETEVLDFVNQLHTKGLVNVAG